MIRVHLVRKMAHQDNFDALFESGDASGNERDGTSYTVETKCVAARALIDQDVRDICARCIGFQ